MLQQPWGRVLSRGFLRTWSGRPLARFTPVLRSVRCISSGTRLQRLGEEGPDPDQQVFVSESADPYYNLTLEDWLFRKANQDTPLLLLYRDSPCVVIGRNQNPWVEVNFKALRAAKVPFIRRRSGGGTVYHDLGNTNFSIQLPRKDFDRHATGQLVLRAVRSLGIEARMNDRNDLCIGPHKVSGSAYKIVNRRAYHHGTMLISTRLDQLGDLLRPEKTEIVTKGVASVRSPVCNLQQHDQRISHEMFVQAVIQEFQNTYGVSRDIVTVLDSPEIRRLEYFRHGMEELQSWGWQYGQCPEFSQTIRRSFPWGNVALDIHSRHGLITEATFHIDASQLGSVLGEELDMWSKVGLIGQRYGPLFSVTASATGASSAHIPETRDVITWLETALDMSR